MKYGIIGINGRMGKKIKSLFKKNEHKLVFSFDINHKMEKEKPEVLIDFSMPGALDQTIEFIEKFKCPLVIGTTGFTDEQLAELQTVAQSYAIVQALNFSVGIQMMIKMAGFLNDNIPDWDVEIEETHHHFKEEKPSETANMLKNVFDTDVNVSSLRLGNVPGDHKIHFGGLGEIITISHRALSGRTFAEGVLKSAEFILNKKSGYYSFADVLFRNQNANIK